MKLEHPALTVLPPDQDRYLERCYVRPPVMDALLDAHSTLVNGKPGVGKSALAWMGRKSAAEQWLNVDFPAETAGAPIDVLVPAVTQGLWERIEQQPHRLLQLGARRTAVKYFLTEYLDMDFGYLLARLADDHPEISDAVRELTDAQRIELFRAHAGEGVRLDTLCDCAQGLGLQGVIVWIDVDGARTLAELPTLRALFDTVSLMRKRSLFFKCLATPGLCHELAALRSAVTLSVDLEHLSLTTGELIKLTDARLQLAHKEIPELPISTAALAGQMGTNVNDMIQFLEEFADATSPAEWIALAGCAAAALGAESETQNTAAWSRARRAFFAARLKLRMDADGVFWRGCHQIEGLTPRKRALYGLVKYLYEHPGFQLTYRMAAQLDTEQENVNTMVHRIRKDFLEPAFAGETAADEQPIYLVTDLRGNGYALRNTVHRAD